MLACLVVVGGRLVAFREVEVVLVAMQEYLTRATQILLCPA